MNLMDIKKRYCIDAGKGYVKSLISKMKKATDQLKADRNERKYKNLKTGAIVSESEARRVSEMQKKMIDSWKMPWTREQLSKMADFAMFVPVDLLKQDSAEFETDTKYILKETTVLNPGGKPRWTLVPADGGYPIGVPTYGWATEKNARRWAEKQGDIIVSVKRLPKFGPAKVMSIMAEKDPDGKTVSGKIKVRRSTDGGKDNIREEEFTVRENGEWLYTPLSFENPKDKEPVKAAIIKKLATMGIKAK